MKKKNYSIEDEKKVIKDKNIGGLFRIEQSVLQLSI